MATAAGIIASLLVSLCVAVCTGALAALLIGTPILWASNGKRAGLRFAKACGWVLLINFLVILAVTTAWGFIAVFGSGPDLAP